MGATLIMAMP